MFNFVIYASFQNIEVVDPIYCDSVITGTCIA